MHNIGITKVLISFIFVQIAMANVNGIHSTENQKGIDVVSVNASVVQDSGRKLLLEYSGVPEKEINSHVETIVSHPKDRPQLIDF
jgi:hypothetical protein